MPSLQPNLGPDRAARAGALDALRLSAAVFIVLYHFGSSAPIDLTGTYAFLGRGWLATDFFIILSGYVLGRAHGDALDRRELSPQRFLLKRLARVWPAHLIVLFALAVMVLAAGLIGLPADSPERFQATDFIQQALLIHAWGGSVQPSWNEPSWTLSALVACYALFPLIWLAGRPMLGRGAALAAGFGLMLTAALLSPGLLGGSLFDLPFHQGVLRAVPLFVMGALTARFVQGRTFSRAAAVASTLAALGALVCAQATERTEFSALACMAALITLIVSAEGLALRRTRWVKAGAGMAFALFITHAVTGTVWFSLMQALGVQTSWLSWFGAWAAVVTVAAAFHRFVDQPIQSRLNGLLTPRREQTQTDAPRLA